MYGIPPERKAGQTLCAIKMTKEKDEITFLNAISNVLSDKYLFSNKIKKPISERHLYFNKDFRNFQLEENIRLSLNKLTKKLKCSFLFSKGGLYQYLDLMVFDHPELGSRLIEFDEEQHFTIYRKESIRLIKGYFPTNFWSKYLVHFENIEYQKQMLIKHMINYQVEELIDSIHSFEDIISKHTNDKNCYVKSKRDFPFIGGRIAQRAYFDILRDIAQFDKRNSHLESIIRFSKFEFEEEYHQPFKKIKPIEMEIYIKRRLLE